MMAERQTAERQMAEGRGQMAEMGTRTPLVVSVLAAILLCGGLYVGFTPMRGGPALGAFLDPAHGVWALARHADLPARQSARISGLRGGVEVRYDDRSVPHIFARNSDDANRALGWVHARDRLFQMEMQTRAVAGTLSELAGPRLLTLDREARALGLAWGAERTFKTIDPASASGRAVAAYADGVNAYISQMPPTDLPLEYRLLNARPMKWEPKHSLYLLSRMGLTLAFTDGELRRAQVEALVGRAASLALFPANAPVQEPIQPNGQRMARLDWAKLPEPKATDGTKLALARELESAVGRFAALPRDNGEIVVGSNNWAVSPKRTAAGHALLAGDPHLALSLPSIWYEAHLVVADSLDAYGVTLPGAPFITIGFNRNIAWTMTNTGADVADYYTETVDDDVNPTQYRLDGAWKPIELQVETFRDAKGAVIGVDTVRRTHRGMMLHAGKRWISRRWTVTDPSDNVEAFRLANRASSAAGFLTAMQDYVVPAQNMLTADRGGHIAIRSTGHYPSRAKSAALGDQLLDGTTSANDWQGWWPLADYPQAFDPAQGFLASNNQQPKDPKVDGKYFGWDWPAPWRAMRINALLRADSAVTPDAMRRYQTDSKSEQTQVFLSAFQAAAMAAPAPRDSAMVRAARLLGEWDGRFTKENERAVLYDAALDELTRRTWDELAVPGAQPDDRPRRTATPNSMILAELLQDPRSIWWDDRSTKDVREDRDAILRASLGAAYTRVVKQYGEPGASWRWERARVANIHHLLRLPALSRLGIPMQSGPGTLSPSSGDGTHGASWRMVVELGDEVRAWGTYPGGQSGNPVSRRYDDRLKHWAAGELDTLRFPHTAADLSGKTLTSTLNLTPER
jgi:penicillin amidase